MSKPPSHHCLSDFLYNVHIPYLTSSCTYLLPQPPRRGLHSDCFCVDKLHISHPYINRGTIIHSPLSVLALLLCSFFLQHYILHSFLWPFVLHSHSLLLPPSLVPSVTTNHYSQVPYCVYLLKYLISKFHFAVLALPCHCSLLQSLSTNFRDSIKLRIAWW